MRKIVFPECDFCSARLKKSVKCSVCTVKVCEMCSEHFYSGACSEACKSKIPNKKWGDSSPPKEFLPKLGKIKVAKFYPGKPQPVSEGYQNVLIHTSKAGIGGPLSPYVLCDEQGHLLENIWQFAKLYREVHAQHTPISRFNPGHIIWEHPVEKHVDEMNNPNNAFWAWRKKGMANKYAVRYPNGYHGRHKCICAIWGTKEKYEILDYISARKKIYCGEYARLAPKTESFKALLKLLQNGENLQLVEVDGPDPYLKYPPYDQISPENPGLLITEETIKMIVNDPGKPFGHGFVIAALLLGGEKWMQ